MVVSNVSALSSLGVNPNIRKTTRHIPALSSLGVRPNVTKVTSTNAPVTRTSSGGGGSSNSGGGGSGGSRYWWQPDWRDSAYNQQLAAINRALADFETELGLSGKRYGTDYLEGVRELGYRPGEAFQPTVDIFALPQISATGATGAAGLEAVRTAMGGDQSPMQRLGSAGGAWDYEGEYDPFTAAYRGTRTARDEFAGRGMLRSSDFAKSYADFQDRLQDQLNSMEQGRSRFYEDAAIDLAQRRSEAEESRQAARVAAMARAAQAGEYRTR